jgi:hypothetical protein
MGFVPIATFACYEGRGGIACLLASESKCSRQLSPLH